MRTLYMCMALLLLCSIGCQEEKKELKTVKASKYDEFVRNPISAQGVIDSTQAAKFEFEEVIFDFGTIKEGEIVDHAFKFKNVGKMPMVITEATSTCGCTVPNYPKQPIAAGESGVINVQFKSENRVGFQDKPISLYANTLPGKTVIRVRGRVTEK